MPIEQFDRAIVPLLVSPAGLLILCLGLRGVALRRPFVISSRWVFAFVVLCIGPIGIHAVFRLGADRLWLNVIDTSLLILFAIIIAFLYSTMRGFTVIGVTEESLRDALRAALRQLNLPYEQTGGAVRLVGLDAKMRVATRFFIGMADLRACGVSNPSVFNAIARALNDQFRWNKVTMNWLACTNLCLVGVVLVLLPLYVLVR